MAKATIVRVLSIGQSGIGIWWHDKPLKISKLDFSTGSLTIHEITTILTIRQVAEFVIGCFESRSTFFGVKNVTFTFEKVTVTVNKKEAKNNPAYVIEQWEKAKTDNAEAQEKVEKFSAYLDENIDE